MRLIRKFLDWVQARRLDRDDYDHSALDFPDLNLDHVLRRLRVIERAGEAGSQNIPPTTSMEVDANETRFKLFFEERVNHRINRSRSIISTYENLARTNSVEDLIFQLNSFSSRVNDKFSQFDNDVRDPIGLQKRRLGELEKEFRDFKSFNHLTTPPKYPKSLFYHYGILSVMLLVETLLNAYFFSKGSDLGYLGGMMQALMLAGLNVFGGFGFGKYVFPQKNHMRKSRRTLAALGFSVYLVYLFRPYILDGIHPKPCPTSHTQDTDHLMCNHRQRL